MRRMPGTDFTGWHVLLGIAGFVGTLLLIALITLLVIFIVKRSKGPSHPRPGHLPPLPPALQILDERLARGEIEIEDYQNRKAAMLGAPAPAADWAAWPEPGQDPDRAKPAPGAATAETSVDEG